MEIGNSRQWLPTSEFWLDLFAIFDLDTCYNLSSHMQRSISTKNEVILILEYFRNCIQMYFESWELNIISHKHWATPPPLDMYKFT